ncbi:hypothetical protein [Erwinia sp. V71]|uniref:hypothetical protein n=1 Tax=Erwinia sp. V71 TaxID=3369424 RepID=UPI003F5E6B94
MKDEDMDKAIREKINAEIYKLLSESGKITKETFWYPVVVASGMIAAIATILTVVHKLFY